ncbi:hypothetical protein UK82_30700 [Frankia sp. ACN1ag]|nr:hypothetical protein UK82_30700 [Frankia sp. ACN1ag]
MRVVLEAADREARALLDDHAGGEHLVLALLATQRPTRDVLARRGISCDGARALLTGVPGR